MPKHSSTKDFIEKARKIHGHIYNYTEVEYEKSCKKVKIYCKKCKKYFYQTPNNHLAGKGCTSCKYKVISKKLSSSKKKFIEQAKKIHGLKYNYKSVVYEGGHKKVKIYCKNCQNFFEQTPSSHLVGCGCPHCSAKQRGEKLKVNFVEFIRRAKQIHKDNYIYDCKTYINSNIKTKIYCKKCKRYFWQLPYNHITGQGCPTCSIENSKKTLNEFIEKAQQIHGNKYNYDSVCYQRSNIKIQIYCNKCKQYFLQTPNKHLSGQGCPYCKKSKGENRIKKLLDDNNIFYIQEKRFKDCKDKYCLPFDFYLPYLNICIEYQGQQHYNCILWNKKMLLQTAEELFQKQQYHDQIKRNYCKKNNIKLIEIRYDEDIEKRLKKEIHIIIHHKNLSKN